MLIYVEINNNPKEVQTYKYIDVKTGTCRGKMMNKNVHCQLSNDRAKRNITEEVVCANAYAASILTLQNACTK